MYEQCTYRIGAPPPCIHRDRHIEYVDAARHDARCCGTARSVRSVEYRGRMKKRLCMIGNSLAVIIDAPIRRMLNLGTRSVLRVTTDGRRIIIEPTGELLEPSELRNPRRALRARSEAETSASKTGDGHDRYEEIDLYGLGMDARSIFLELADRRGMSPDRLQPMWHEPNPRYTRIAAWLSDPNCAVNASEAELASILRLRRCRELLRAGASWDVALRDVLQAFPKQQGEPALPNQRPEPSFPNQRPEPSSRQQEIPAQQPS